MLLENGKKQTCNSRAVVLAAMVVIGTIAAYNWFVTAHTNYLQAAQKYVSVADNLEKRNLIIGSSVAIKKKDLQRLQEELERGQVGLFDPSGAREFFSNIQVIAKKSECSISLLEFLPMEPPQQADDSQDAAYVAESQAVLQVAGRYGNIIALIDRLQERTEKVWIYPLNIESISGKPGRLECDMTISIYVTQKKGLGSHD